MERGAWEMLVCLGGWVVRVLKGRGREGERGWEDGRMGG